MATLAGDVLSDIKRSLRDMPPAHYTLEINSFSDLQKMLKETNRKNYESQTFEVGGYKWKLSLYPNGDEERNGKGHISMYLVIADTDALPLGWEVHAKIKLFIFDHILDKFLKIQDALKRVRCFNRMKTEWGFPELITESAFQDESNGYLNHGKCAFGAEISVRSLGKGERLEQMKNVNSSYIWKFNAFSSSYRAYDFSEIFTLANIKWRLKIYPKGNFYAAGKYVSLFLYLEEPKAPTFYAEFKISILDTSNVELQSLTAKHWFSAADTNRGSSTYISLSDINDKSKGFLVNDTLTIETRIINLSTLKCFS